MAGSTPLNRDAPRYSNDIDVFHDREQRVALAAQDDAALLEQHGYAVRWLRRDPALSAVMAERDGERTKLEWVADSDFRFFPTMPDETFGYVLHPVDLATNKVAAAYGRSEPRDVVDLLVIHERILPLGAAIWASGGKAPGFTPEGIINEIRRVARYTEADFRWVNSDPPLDPAATIRRLWEVLHEAEAFFLRMLSSKARRPCSPIPVDWTAIARMPDSGAAIGRRVPRSPAPCLNGRRKATTGTSRTQAPLPPPPSRLEPLFDGTNGAVGQAFGHLEFDLLQEFRASSAYFVSAGTSP